MPARLLAVLIALAPVIFGADAVSDAALQIQHVTHTDTFPLPAGGALRFEHSIGELDIEGWDRPEVQVTVIKSTKGFYPAKDRVATADLDRVHVSAEIKGKDVVVSTGYPHHSFPLNFPWAEPGIEVEYQVKAPMAAAMFVDHGKGEVHFYNVSGDVQAKVHNGSIMLALAPDSRYNIQASSDWGAPISYFPGTSHRRFWLIGHQFTAKSDGGHELALKAGYGDIVIFKNWKPDATQ